MAERWDRSESIVIVIVLIAGTDLDNNVKQWRLFADILNDVSIFIELLAPMFPATFTLLVCTASLFRSLVGVAGGATRASLNHHQARSV